MDKKTVLEYFHNKPEIPAVAFNQAFEHYRQSPGKNSNIERMLNSSVYTKYNLETVEHELQRLYDITDLEKIPPIPVDAVEPTLAKDIDLELKVESSVPEITQDTGEGVTSATPEQSSVKKEEVAAVPGDRGAEAPVKLREEYTFLNEPDCPNDLKILVADKISAYKRYQDAHAQLQQAKEGQITLSDKEQLELTKTSTEAFAQSEAIKKELDHYQENKVILGEHPTFARLIMQREVDTMTNEEAHNFIANSGSTISRTKSTIKKTESEKKKVELQNKLDARLEKIEMAKKKLGLSAGK